MAKLLVHGGASHQTSADVNDAKLKATKTACLNVNLKGAAALDLVETAVARQELEPDLNAGVGSIVQLDGRIRMDAGICNSEGRYGAVIQIEQVATPIKVARRILDIGYHSILSGEGARLFAIEQGFAAISPFTPKRLEEYQQMRSNFPELTYAALSVHSLELNAQKLGTGTVGAVAIDDSGHLAAACSTGGTKFCYPGRVGDVAIFGAGVYCSKHVAVSCTGEGDKMVRRLTARRVEDLFLIHSSLKKAVDEAVQDLLKTEKGYCGIIAIANTGETAHAHSTSFMAYSEK